MTLCLEVNTELTCLRCFEFVYSKLICVCIHCVFDGKVTWVSYMHGRMILNVYNPLLNSLN